MYAVPYYITRHADGVLQPIEVWWSVHHSPSARTPSTQRFSSVLDRAEGGKGLGQPPKERVAADSVFDQETLKRFGPACRKPLGTLFHSVRSHSWDLPISLLNRPGDRSSGDPEMPGNLRCRKAKLGGCPVGDCRSGLTRFGASAATPHLMGVDPPPAAFLINEMKHGITGGSDLHLTTLLLFCFPEYRHDEFTASQDSFVPFLRCTMLPERGYL